MKRLRDISLLGLLSGKTTAAIVAVVLLFGLAACGNDNEGRQEPEPEVFVPISMSAYASDGQDTKGSGAIESQDDLQNVTFGVYAHDTIKNVPKVDIFTNQSVSYLNNKWSYSPEKYWNEKATYYFAAYSPKMNSSASGDAPYVSQSYSNKTATLTLYNIPYWQSAETGDDFMYDKQKNTGSEYVKAGGTVNFTFKHLLSRLIIKAYYSGDANSVSVTDLSVGGTAAGTGMPQADGKVDSWSMVYTSSDEPDGINATLGGKKTLLSGGDISLTKVSAKTIADYFVAPYTASGDAKEKPVTISYKNDGTSNTPEPVTIDVKKMEAGKMYILTLKIETKVEGDYVVVVGAEVKTWEEATASGNLYNW